MIAILQMTHTHRGASGYDAGASGSHPHPTPAEMMAQLMETQCSIGEVLHGLA